MPNSEARSEWERRLIEAGLSLAMLVSMLDAGNSKLDKTQNNSGGILKGDDIFELQAS